MRALREELEARTAVHVTLKTTRPVPNLRARRRFSVIKQAFVKFCDVAVYAQPPGTPFRYGSEMPPASVDAAEMPGTVISLKAVPRSTVVVVGPTPESELQAASSATAAIPRRRVRFSMGRQGDSGSQS